MRKHSVESINGNDLSESDFVLLLLLLLLLCLLGYLLLLLLHLLLCTSNVAAGANGAFYPLIEINSEGFTIPRSSQP